MSESTYDPGEQQALFEAVLAEMLLREEQGESVDFETYFQNYPLIAERLRAYFGDREHLEFELGKIARINEESVIGGQGQTVTWDGSVESDATLGVACGTIWDDFEIIQELGRGGMGIVYKARQLSLKRFVALKIILNPNLMSPSLLARFLNEAEAIARIDHPNIVRIYQFGNINQRPFLVLEYIDGGTLQGRIQENPLAPKAAAVIVEQLARAMAVSHQQCIVHRDLKPLNVMMTRDGLPKITDFGLAKRIDASVELTQTGVIIGTPPYMSPEQASGETKEITASSDIHALGAILYALLIGRPPFLGPTTQAILHQVMHTDPVSPRAILPTIPRDLETICLKCLRKEAKDRYSNASALADDLRAYLEERSILARPMGRLERITKWVKKNPSWATLMLLFILSLLTGTAVSLYYADSLRRTVNSLRQEQENTQRAFADNRIPLAEIAWNNSTLQVGRNGSGDTSLSAKQANDFLDAIPERFRKWEWGYLKRKYQGSFATYFSPNRRSVDSMSLSADGNHLAELSTDDEGVNANTTIRLRDPKSGKIRAQLVISRQSSGMSGGPIKKYGICLNPDGTRVVVIRDYGITVWDTQSGAKLRDQHVDGLNGFFGLDRGQAAGAFSPDGKQFAIGTNQLYLFNAETGKEIFRIRGGGGVVAFSPDGARLASSSSPGQSAIRVWNSATGQMIREFSDSWGGCCLSFSPDGVLLASGFAKGKIRIWNAATGVLIREWEASTHAVESLSFAPDGTWLATASDNRISLWDIETGTMLRELKGHTDTVNDVIVCPDGTRLISGSVDGTIRVWKVFDVETSPEVLYHSGDLTSLSFNEDGRYLAVASRKIRLWDVRSGVLVRTMQAIGGHDHAFSGLSLSPDGSRLVCQNSSQSSHDLFDAMTGDLIRRIHEPSSTFYPTSFQSEGFRKVNFEAGLVQRWNGERWEEISQLERYRELFGVKIDNLAQSPDGMHFATRARNGSVRIWDLGTGKLTFEGSTDKGTWLCMALSPGGTRFALGTFHTGRIRVWDGKSGRQTFDLNGHSDGVVSLQFNHDGTRLASGSRDNSIRIWDTFSGLSLVEIKGHTAQVDHLSFSPNGLRLASGSRDGTVRIWSGHPPPQSDEAVNEDELAFRHAMWQPHPNWHSVRSKELRKSKKEFAASVQHYLFCKASAEELIEWGDLSGANRFLKEAEVARAEVRRLVKWNP